MVAAVAAATAAPAAAVAVATGGGEERGGEGAVTRRVGERDEERQRRGGERRGKTPARARGDEGGTRGGGRGRKGAGERTREGEQHSFERVVKSPRLPRIRGSLLLFFSSFSPFPFLLFIFFSSDASTIAFFLVSGARFLRRERISMSRRLSLFLFAFYRVRLDPLDRLVDDGFSLSLPWVERTRASHTLALPQLTIALSGTVPLVNARPR